MSRFEGKTVLSERSKEDDSVSDEVQEKDLHLVILQKDKQIMRLQNKIQRLEKERQTYLKGSQMNKPDFNEMLYLKQKLGQQLHGNQKGAFLHASQRLSKLIGLLQTKSDLSNDSGDIRGLLNNIGGSSIQNSFLENSEIDSSDDEAEQRNSEQKWNKMMDHLQLIVTEFRKQFQTVKRGYDCLERKVKELKQQNEEQNSAYERDYVSCKKERQHFKKLLEKSQIQKNSFLNNVMGVLSVQNERQLERMDKPELMNFIRKMLFRLQQVESEKKEVQKTYSKSKEIDLEKYKKMLSEVKKMKDAQEAWNGLQL